MKRILIAAILVCLFAFANAQIRDTIRRSRDTAGKKNTFNNVAIAAQFPGGIAALYNYIESNINQPNDGAKGKVVVSFVVDKDGSLIDIKILKSLSKAADDETTRLLKASPKWKPGMQNSRVVRQQYTVPLMFN